MKSLLIGLVATASAAGLATATPIYANHTLSIRANTQTTTCFDDDKPKQCKGLMDLIKSKRTQNGKTAKVGNDPRNLCSGECCISWTEDTEWTWQDMFRTYQALRKSCPKQAARQIDTARAMAVCMNNAADNCEYDARKDQPLFIDTDSPEDARAWPEGCWFDVTFDPTAVNVYAIGGSGTGRDPQRESGQDAWNIEQFAANALETCRDGNSCQTQAAVTGSAFKYACGKGKTCQRMAWNHKDGMGEQKVTATMEFQNVESHSSGNATVPNKLIEIMSAAVTASARAAETHQLMKGEDDWSSLVYQTVPQGISVQFFTIHNGRKEPAGTLKMSFSVCHPEKSDWLCEAATGALGMTSAFGAIEGFLGAAGSLLCGDVGSAGTPSC